MNSFAKREKPATFEWIREDGQIVGARVRYPAGPFKFEVWRAPAVRYVGLFLDRR